jgi:radical SAM superfamily enzyme YgiQ (UPF0313 family)
MSSFVPPSLTVDLRRRYHELLRYEEKRQQEATSAAGDPEQRRRPAVDLGEMPVVYLCGHTSEVHRWGVDHDENDFVKQLDALARLSRSDATHHVMVGVRRTNFHRLVKIYDLVRRVRGQEEVGLSDLNLDRTAGLFKRFHRCLADLNRMGAREGINFRVVDPQLDELLHTIERAPSRHDYDHGDLMRALGPVCKDVFIDPRHILSRSSAPPSPEDFALLVCPAWETTMPPVWPALLAASLRDAGYEGTCHDLNNKLHRRVDPELRYLWGYDSLYRWWRGEDFDYVWAMISRHVDELLPEILAPRPAVVGFSVIISNLRASLAVARKIREADPEITILFGGPGIYCSHPTDHGPVPMGMVDPWSHEYIDREHVVDLFLRGEADLALPRLLHHLREGLDPLEVPGTFAFRGGMWVAPRPPEAPRDLDALPSPDFSDLEAHSYGALPLLTSRGCQRRCAFCNDCFISGKFRALSGERVYEEVARCRRLYGTTGFALTDLMINGRPDELGRMCDLLLDNDVEVSWGGQAVVRPEMDRALLQKLGRTGCQQLSLGIETFSQPVVDLMNKRYTVPDGLRMMREAREAGIDVAINFIVGFPGETVAMHEETLQTLRREHDLLSKVQTANLCAITYGSRLQQNLERYGVTTDDSPGFEYRFDAPHGNTFAERLRRLRELLATVEEVGLVPPGEVNTYEASLEEEPEVPLELADTPAPIRVTHLTVHDLDGEERYHFEVGEPLVLRVAYRVAERLEEPLLRLQIFNEQNPRFENVFVFGHNTARTHHGLGTMEPGVGEAELRLPAPRLMPGAYTISVGFWPEEEAARPYHAEHGRYKLMVRGEQEPSGAFACLDHRWSVTPAGPAEQGEDRLSEGLRLLDATGAGRSSCPTGAALTASVRVDLHRGAPVLLRATIHEEHGHVVHHTVLELPRAPGRYDVELTYRELDLLGGRYELRLTLVDARTEGELSCLRRTLAVESLRDQGAGIVFMSASWDLSRPSADGAVPTPRRPGSPAPGGHRAPPRGRRRPPAPRPPRRRAAAAGLPAARPRRPPGRGRRGPAAGRGGRGRAARGRPAPAPLRRRPGGAPRRPSRGARRSAPHAPGSAARAPRRR